MNPLYHFLARFTKKLEQQADLDVVNKLLIIYFINITAIVVNLVYGILSLQSKNYSLALFLLATALLLSIILFFLTLGRKLKASKLLLTILAAIEIFFLLFTGGTEGLGMLWIFIFPAFCIPLLV